MKIPDSVYSVLKWLDLVCLPALATLYKVLSAEWGLPYPDEISTTVLAVCTFLGAIIGVSTATYNAEQKKVSEDTSEE